MDLIRKKIIVIGGFNTDMIVKAVKFPLPGETVSGGQFSMNPGGRGANQAIAAARLGADVVLVARVGNDVFGRQALQQFQRENIDTRYVIVDRENPSGVAIVNVDESGETRMAVSPGANNYLSPLDVDTALETAEKDTIILLQLEIPMDTIEYVIRKGNERGLKVILSPVSVNEFPPSLYPLIYAIIPNEMEAQSITGIPIIDFLTAKQAAMKMEDLGIQNVIITLGIKGAYMKVDNISGLVPALQVKAVDSTGGRDSFCSALAVAMSEGSDWEEAVTFAFKVASLSVKELGAQTSMPYRRQVEEQHLTLTV